jgi:ribosomal protein S18 acetylase RimI-like enzyme
MLPEGVAQRPAVRYSWPMLTYRTAADEEREQFLSLLGIAGRPEARGQGLATHVLRDVEAVGRTEAKREG